MRLGLNLGYLAAWSTPADHLALAQEADRLGFSVVWAAEAYGSDSPTMLAWIAGADRADRRRHRGHADPGAHPGDDRDDRRDARHAVRRPVPARPRRLRPAGLRGLARRARSRKPLGRTREYVDIVKLALARRAGRATTASSTSCRCRTVPGKALRLTVHPVREHIPIYLAAVGPKNLELTGEIADGWLAIFFAPGVRRASCSPPIAAGRAKVGKTLDGFDVVADGAGRDRRRRRVVRRAGALVRRALRRRHGQPGAELLQPARHPDGLRRRGRARSRSCTWPSGSADAAAAVPLEFIDRTSLLGPVERDRASGCATYADGRRHHAVGRRCSSPTRRPASARCARSPRRSSHPE